MYLKHSRRERQSRSLWREERRKMGATLRRESCGAIRLDAGITF